MDYEKKYNETLERAKSIKDSIIASHNKESASYYTGFIDNIFPELKESEDERIRKQIEQALIEHDWSATYKVSKDECLDYLEKRKEQKLVDLSEMMVHKEPYIAPVPIPIVADEQKPAEWSEEDEKCIKIIETALYTSKTVSHDSYLCASDFLKTLPRRFNFQQVQEWSEEDESDMKDIIKAVEEVWMKEDADRMIRLLKSLSEKFNPQTHWKPSEEQMEALHTVCYVPELEVYGGLTCWLKELYEQLKKL